MVRRQMAASKWFGVAFVVLGAMLLAPNAFAGSVTLNGTTLTWPEYPQGAPNTGTPLASCEPTNSPAGSISFTGVPTGATVTVNFGWYDPIIGGPAAIQPAMQFNNVTGGTLVVGVPYPADTATWPGYDAVTNERSIGLTVFAVVTSNSINTKLVSSKWWIKCSPPPPPPPDEGDGGGCTPGYWKNHKSSWLGYLPTEDYNAVFGVSVPFSPHTLLDALWAGGGAQRALARHSVAALLNAAQTTFSFTYTEAEVIAGVQAAYLSGDFETFKNLLDAANNMGCPLNGKPDDDDDGHHDGDGCGNGHHGGHHGDNDGHDHGGHYGGDGCDNDHHHSGNHGGNDGHHDGHHPGDDCGNNHHSGYHDDDDDDKDGNHGNRGRNHGRNDRNSRSFRWGR